MGKKNKGASAQRGGAPGPAFGNGAGSPQNGKKEEWPLWSPQKIYWLLDDLVYKAVEKCYEKLNNLAGKLGKKTPVPRWVAATGALALGNALNCMTIDGPKGCEWGIDTVSTAVFSILTLVLANTARAIEKDANGETSASGAKAASPAALTLRVLRLPFLGAGVVSCAAAMFAEHALRGMWLGTAHMGMGIYCYLLSGKNGTGKKVKEALEELGAKLHLGLAKKDPVPVKKKPGQ